MTNVVVISGRLTHDAELKDAGGYSLCTFSIAFDVGWGDRKHAVFVECKWWGKGAVAILEYLTKGKRVTVTGAWDCEKWKDNHGQERKKDLIVVSGVELGPGGQQQGGADRPKETTTDDLFQGDLF